MENNIVETDISLEHSTRVEKSIQEKVNHYYKDHQEIEQRLMELDNEWEIERVLQLVAASISFTGVLLGIKQNKRWLALPLTVTGFLMNHAIFGWSPPLPILKALGFRERAEIDKEKYALKALRGDFSNQLPVPNAVWNAVNL